ncbi:MAG TPA: M43 family zinc metalloprotease [Adhaeribacter sp.]|nr:M43 family zinc metalloprotease [Adhaeribacter sp.]
MKFKNLLLASATTFLLGTGAANAQSNKNYGCFTDEHQQELEQKDPSLFQHRQAMEQQFQQFQQWRAQNQHLRKGAGPVLKIPVVVHVVTEKGLGGISKAQVLDGLQVLNEDFRRMNTDQNLTRPIFAPYAADFEIEFALARIDPQGNPTEGIVRVTSFATNGIPTRDDIKRAAPSWPADKYFNVWLVNAISGGQAGQTILGYAQFPNNSNLSTYGLVMMHREWGKQGRVQGSTAVTDGRTATHEMGHCLNLYHTFQGGCGTSCSNTGDLVCDTPPSANSTWLPCNNTSNTCSNDVSPGSPYTTDVVDQTENYMSYDQCQNMFTNGQKTRTTDAIAFYPYLSNLTSSNSASPSNAVVTGIDPSVTVGALIPQPYFGSNTNRVCAGSSVNFTDASYNGTVTSWNWSFPGGTPATSTQQNPVVTYSNPGVYSVTLTAGNVNGSRIVTLTDNIRVVPTSGLVGIAAGQQYVEDFEDPNFPANSAPNRSYELETTSFTTGSPNWERTPAASSTGNFSLRVRNASIDNGTISTLITPNIDVTGITGSLNLSFDLAYARKAATPAEELKVYVSNDCGATWYNRYTKIGTQLVTNGGVVIGGTFTPGAADWRNERINITNNFLSSGHVMFKIEAVSRGGNNLYLDNLRIFTILGTNEEIAKTANISVYPNPVTTETGINFELKTAQKVSVKVFDLVGNTIYAGAAENLSAGTHSIGLYDKMKNVSAGMYMVQLTIGNKVYNTKLFAK